MFLKQRSTGHLLAVVDLDQLFGAFHPAVLVRDQVGEEQQEPERVAKTDLVFPSGEPLPRCWTDAHYRDDALRQKR